MFEKLDAYLEEISHFLSGRTEREEILAEIRSHILEKAEDEHGDVTALSLDKVIVGYGPARRVAEKYLDGQPIIAPAYKRYLFRYTTFLFVVHSLLTLFALVFGKTFVVFPFIFMPRLSVIDAIMYLPTAFLADLGVVTLILYLITQSGKDIKLPWPKFAVDLDEVRPPKKGVPAARIVTLVVAIMMLAVTNFAIYLYVKHQTIFFVNMNFTDPRPLLTPEAGLRISLIVIAMLASGTLALFTKVFVTSRWVDVASNTVGLVLVGLLLRQPFDNLFAVDVPAFLLPKIKLALNFALLFIAVMIAVELIKNFIRIGRRHLPK